MIFDSSMMRHCNATHLLWTAMLSLYPYAPSTSLSLVLDHILQGYFCKAFIKVPLSNPNLKPSYSTSKTSGQTHHLPIFQTHTTLHLGYSSARSIHGFFPSASYALLLFQWRNNLKIEEQMIYLYVFILKRFHWSD